MIRTEGSALLLDVLVAPRAARAKLGPVHDGRLKVAVAAPPVDGAANRAVTIALAKALGIGKQAAVIAAGHSSRRKTVRLEGVTREQVEALCG